MYIHLCTLISKWQSSGKVVCKWNGNLIIAFLFKIEVVSFPSTCLTLVNLSL